MDSLAAARRRRRSRGWRGWWRRSRRQVLTAAVAVTFVAILLALGRPCTGKHEPPRVPPPNGDPEGACAGQLDGAGPTPCPYLAATGTVDGADFARAFEREGHTCVSAGRLRLTSGRVVATDPLVFIEAKPNVIAFAPGRYPVVLAMEHGDVAYALLQVGAARPVRWALALQVGEAEPPPGQQLGYPVDSGTGGYLDDEAARLIERRTWEAAADPARARDVTEEPYPLDVLVRAGYHQRPWANVCVDPSTGANLVAFTSGAGDGIYPVYLGFDAAGAPVALVTDFGLGPIGTDRDRPAPDE